MRAGAARPSSCGGRWRGLAPGRPRPACDEGQGSGYRSGRFARLCRSAGLRHLRIRSYTPRTNGKAERFIQTLLREWPYRRAYPSPSAAWWRPRTISWRFTAGPARAVQLRRTAPEPSRSRPYGARTSDGWLRRSWPGEPAERCYHRAAEPSVGLIGLQSLPGLSPLQLRQARADGGVETAQKRG
jgi:transposase InsO family protein